MFLFTTPGPAAAPSPAAPGATPSGAVVDAIRRGAEQTGTDFAYLLNTAKRESSLDPAAKAGTSSATGLFQFIEQTWLGLVKQEGAKLGLGDLSAAIAPKGDGAGFTVPDAGARSAILKLREDPGLASLMAGTLTQQNAEALTAATGRAPSSGELYMAHLLGARGAADLIRTVASDPTRAAAADLPEAAAANRALFYDRSGQPRSAGDLYAALSATPAGAAAAAGGAAVATATGSARPVTVTGEGGPLPKLTGPALYGLFQTGERTGPLSGAVAKLWKVNNAPATAKSAALGFFPRVDGEVAGPDPAPADAATVASTASPAVTGVGATAVGPAAVGTPAPGIPLPPPRPKALAGAAR